VIGIEIILHDGPARLGRLHVNGSQVDTPSGCFFREVQGGHRLFDIGPEVAPVTLAVPPSPLVEPPPLDKVPGSQKGHLLVAAGEHQTRGKGKESGAQECSIIRLSDQALEPEPSTVGSGLVILEPGPQQDPVRLMEGIIELRQKLSPNAAIMLADADVWSFPLFALVGADLFGDSQATASAWAGELLFESFSVPVEGIDRDACHCPFCGGGTQKAGRDVLGHNRWMTKKVLSEIRTNIRLGELKHLAEESCTRHPDLAAALKILYRKHLSYLEQFTTVCPGVGP